VPSEPDQSAEGGGQEISARGAETVRGEPRWPMACAVVAAIVLTLLLPDAVRPGPSWLLPAIEAVLLLALVVGDPGEISRRSSLLRGLSLALVTVLVAGALVSTVALIDDLIEGGPTTNSASDLLEAGTLVWLSNVLAFALLYWELDGGGAAARIHERPRRIDLAFPQEVNPQLGRPGWSPRFIDYLYLGFTNATAFSPTDVMPLTPLPKISMTVQALISLAILGLVVARAVNVFS
jgi:uncharacterized membrane protein